MVVVSFSTQFYPALPSCQTAKRESARNCRRRAATIEPSAATPSREHPPDTSAQLVARHTPGLPVVSVPVQYGLHDHGATKPNRRNPQSHGVLTVSW